MQASVRKTDRLVVQYGHGLGERADCDIVELDDATEAQLLAAMRMGTAAVVTDRGIDIVDGVAT